MTSPTQPAESRQLTASQMATLLALVQSQAKIRQQLTEAAVAAALAPLQGFSAWWDSSAVDRMIGQVLRVVQPMQRQAARVTDGYLTNAATIVSGRRQRPVGAVDVTRLRRAMTEELADDILAGRRKTAWVELGDPVDGPSDSVNVQTGFGLEGGREFQAPEAAYGKVADGVRYQMTVRGDSPEKAQEKARVRIAAAAETDVTLAVREQYRRNMSSQGATGFRRILHPELSESGPCGLCVVAADRIYKTEDLLPIHSRCLCEVLPVYGRLDPGLTLNGDDLRRLYDAAGGNTREQLRRVRVVMTEHGELGPILVHGERNYRGPEQVARSYASSRRVREQAILDALEPVYRQNEVRVLRGEPVDKSFRWQQKRIEELRRSLARSR